MFSRSRAVTFSRYDQRRSRWRLPRWLWLMLAGTALGTGGVLYVQEEHLPPRLTAEASARMTAAFEQAEAERLRLAQAQSQLNAELTSANEARQQQATELATGRATIERLQGELAVLVEAFPPDPRRGPVAVRAMRFVGGSGELNYDLALSRERGAGRPLAAVLQVVVTGESAGRGEVAAVTLPPVPVSLGPQAVLRGSQPLPAGFKPRQATVRILGGAGGPVLGMRVGLVR
ncbi:MAG: hypothetical protein Q7U73_00435 [Rubrivivax sp.]|nr:hypothetical protein [Rubrivivax sp.]